MRWKIIYILENWMEKPDLLMKKSLSNCNVNELKVLWISSGRADPLHSFRRMLLSIGPSHTFKMSWAASVSKTIKCRLQREIKSAVHYSLNTISQNSKQSFPRLYLGLKNGWWLCSFTHFSCCMSSSWKRDAILLYKYLNYRKHDCEAYSTCFVN